MAEISAEMTFVLDLLRGLDLASGQHSIEDRRRMMEAGGVGELDDDRAVVEPAQLGGVPAEWVRDVDARTDRAVVHLHGGAFTAGSLDTHRSFALHLSRACDAAVAVVDYRLAPEHPFPAALDDALGAVHEVATRVGAGSLVVSGDSAGGGLALATLVARRDRDAAPVAGAVLLSPWTDLTLSGTSVDTEAARDPMCSRASLAPSASAYAGAAALDDPLVSPLFAELAGLPPVLVHVGEVEVLRDDATRLVDRLRASGGEVSLHVGAAMVHVWHLFAGIAPESDAALAEVGGWVRGRFGARPD